MDITLGYLYYAAVVTFVIKVILRTNVSLQYRNGVYLRGPDTVESNFKLLILYDVAPLVLIVLVALFSPRTITLTLAGLLTLYILLMVTPTFGKTYIKEMIVNVVTKLLLVSLLVGCTYITVDIFG